MKLVFQIAVNFKNIKPLDAIKYHEAYTYNEIQRVQKNSIDLYTFSTLKCLYKNNDFIFELTKIRSENNIPTEGYSWQEWQKIKFNDNIFSLKSALSKAGRETLASQFKIPLIINDQLVYILLGNWIYLPLPSIRLELPENY